MRAEFVLLILRKSRLKFLVSFDFRLLQYLFPLVLHIPRKVEVWCAG